MNFPYQTVKVMLKTSQHAPLRSSCIPCFLPAQYRGLIPKSCVLEAFIIMAAYQGSPLCSELKLPCSLQRIHYKAAKLRWKLIVNFIAGWCIKTKNSTGSSFDSSSKFPPLITQSQQENRACFYQEWATNQWLCFVFMTSYDILKPNCITVCCL